MSTDAEAQLIKALAPVPWVVTVEEAIAFHDRSVRQFVDHIHELQGRAEREKLKQKPREAAPHA